MSGRLLGVRRKRRRNRIISDLYAALVYTVLYIPVAVMMIFSFNNQRYNYYWSGFTTEWYAKLFNNSSVIPSTPRNPSFDGADFRRSLPSIAGM